MVVVVELVVVVLELLVDDVLDVVGMSVVVTLEDDEVVVELLDVVLELELELVDVVVVLAAPQTTSACDVEMSRSAMPLTITCSAVTVMSAMLPATVLDCSLITIEPSPSGRGT